MSERMCYVGIKPCGCVVAGCVDDPQWKKDTAKFVGTMIKEGYEVKRVPVGKVTLRRCKCPPRSHTERREEIEA
jgi:hypothetical protein